jgi:hypothetical protein
VLDVSTSAADPPRRRRLNWPDPSTWSQRRLTVVFGAAVALFYLTLVVATGGLSQPFYWDEAYFWRTSLMVTDPSLSISERMERYDELNTPLPFIVFGAVARLVDGGPPVARAVSLALSVAVVLAIGRPRGADPTSGPRAALGLAICPYLAFLSVLLYTDLVAAALGLAGVVLHRHRRFALAAAAFALAISARQFLVAVPAALAAHEAWSQWLARGPDGRRAFRPALSWRWVAPALSIGALGFWIVVFQGLATERAFANKLAPEVQRDVLAVAPGGSLYALFVLGVFFVAVEAVLFPRRGVQRELLAWRSWRWRQAAVIGAVAAAFAVVPPAEAASGILPKVLDVIPSRTLQLAVMFLVAAVAALRFSRGGFTTWLVLAHLAVMAKAHQWDRYAFPVLVVLWYLARHEADRPARSPLDARPLGERVGHRS